MAGFGHVNASKIIYCLFLFQNVFVLRSAFGKLDNLDKNQHSQLVSIITKGINVTSFLSISCLSNCEDWSQKHSQSDKIHSISKMSMLYALVILWNGVAYLDWLSGAQYCML